MQRRIQALKPAGTGSGSGAGLGAASAKVVKRAMMRVVKRIVLAVGCIDVEKVVCNREVHKSVLGEA